MPKPMPAAAGVLPTAAQQNASPLRALAVGILAFLTVADLFATQAILPELAKSYRVSPAVAGSAVNAATIGMATASLAASSWGRCIDRRKLVAFSLALLALPTVLLSIAPNLIVFAGLRVLQGALMATAFAFAVSHLAVTTHGNATATLVAAYVTGNVASNLFGRLLSATVSDMLGLGTNFLVFSVLNLAGSAFAFVALATDGRAQPHGRAAPSTPSWSMLVRDRALSAALVIGFCILFAFIGIFTYVNFVLARPPLSIGMMTIGFVYLVFLPSIVTTPLAGAIAARLGVRRTIQIGIGIAALGLLFLPLPSLPTVLTGLMLFSIGTFMAQATTTGFVGRYAGEAATAATGMYLASYYLGGLVGSVVLGQIFVRFGWTACVAGAGLALALVAYLVDRLELTDGQTA